MNDSARYPVVDPSPSEVLAGFTAGLDLAEVPDDVVRYARVLMLDLLGAALAGVDTEETRAMLKAAEGFAPTAGPCGIWGTTGTTTAASAALINGVIAHAQELDDFGGADHSGAVVIPAVLAVAEAQRVTDGGAVLAAMIGGYDVALRVLDAMGGYRAHNNGGWHSTGTCGSFGAAAAAARLLGLDAERTSWALGIAGSFTGGIWAYLADGAMSKRYHPGRAAEIGVTAAYMARAGFTGPTRVFDAPWGGFLATYGNGGERPEELTRDFGRPFRIMRSGIKPYAACRGLHSVLDVVLGMRAEHGFSAADVAVVEIGCSQANMQSLGGTDPRTRLGAQMSLPYGIAVALVTGRAGLEEFEDRRINDPDVRAAMGRVVMSHDPGHDDQTEPDVAVVLTGGRRFEGREPIGLGDYRNPLTTEQVVDKYESLARRVLDATGVAALKDAVFALPEPGRLQQILATLRLGSTRNAWRSSSPVSPAMSPSARRRWTPSTPRRG